MSYKHPDAQILNYITALLFLHDNGNPRSFEADCFHNRNKHTLTLDKLLTNIHKQCLKTQGCL